MILAAINVVYILVSSSLVHLSPCTLAASNTLINSFETELEVKKSLYVQLLFFLGAFARPFDDNHNSGGRRREQGETWSGKAAWKMRMASGEWLAGWWWCEIQRRSSGCADACPVSLLDDVEVSKDAFPGRTVLQRESVLVAQVEEADEVVRGGDSG